MLLGFWIVVAGVILAPISQMKIVGQAGVAAGFSNVLLITGLALVVVGLCMLAYGAVYKRNSNRGLCTREKASIKDFY